ncbi:MAG: hypothetical protein ACI9JN_000346 [Bacteroidia bacterium]|jgi:hypothetical protein
MYEERQVLKISLDQLKTAVSEFVFYFQERYDYNRMIYDLWTAKDVLGHVLFWQESFARNISDLGTGRIPKPLKGRLFDVNVMSVSSKRNNSIQNLLKRLQDAQKVIEQ